MTSNRMWSNGPECNVNTEVVPRALRLKFSGKKINFRKYYRCKGFFNYRCRMVVTDGEVAAIDEIEEKATARWTFDSNKCYYFESDEDATWFTLAYGVQRNT